MQALIAAAGFERQTVLRQESSGFCLLSAAKL